MRPYELFVGLRYTRAKRRTHFISFISLISMLGIALGIMALIAVMSVMNGFEKEIRARILGAAAHIQVLGPESGMSGWEEIAAVMKRHPEVQAVAPFVAAQGLLSTGSAVRVGYANTGSASLLTSIVALDEDVSFVEQNYRAIETAIGRAVPRKPFRWLLQVVNG